MLEYVLHTQDVLATNREELADQVRAAQEAHATLRGKYVALKEESQKRRRMISNYQRMLDGNTDAANSPRIDFGLSIGGWKSGTPRNR